MCVRAGGCVHPEQHRRVRTLRHPAKNDYGTNVRWSPTEHLLETLSSLHVLGRATLLLCRFKTVREFFSVLEFRSNAALLDGAITATDLIEWFTEVKSKGRRGDEGAWNNLRDVVKVRRTYDLCAHRVSNAPCPVAQTGLMHSCVHARILAGADSHRRQRFLATLDTKTNRGVASCRRRARHVRPSWRMRAS